jgi:hypothetical protein
VTPTYVSVINYCTATAAANPPMRVTDPVTSRPLRNAMPAEAAFQMRLIANKQKMP